MKDKSLELDHLQTNKKYQFILFNFKKLCNNFNEIILKKGEESINVERRSELKYKRSD